MSIWKSPVFYFGVVLLLIVSAALAAPFVVPWNNYKGDLEAFGRKLTGREVTIGGNVAVRLFPWPRLEGQQVTINNPQGFANNAFVQAEAMTVKLSLAGLFNGTLDVESIDVVRPVVSLQRNAAGDVNWFFQPEAQVAGSGLLSCVKLDKISLVEGVVAYDDVPRQFSTRIQGLSATLSAQAIEGPWRLKGQGRWSTVPINISATTSAKEKAMPLKFGIKLVPLDLVYPASAFDGSWDGADLKGAVRIDPQMQDDGAKRSSEGALRPLALQANLEANEKRLSLDKIRIAPVDRKDNGTLIEGVALVEFEDTAKARVELKSPRVNLDTLMGAEVLQQWRDGGLLAVANQVLAALPEKLSTDYALNINVLTSGGQALNDVRLKGIIQREAIRVTEATADLPGRSSAAFDGIIFPGDDAAQLTGKLQFESSDARSFVSWAHPAWRAALEHHWTGSRGRLVLKNADVTWSGTQFGLQNMDYTFEGVVAKGEILASLRKNRSVLLRIDTDTFDVDNLLPNGWSFLRDGGLTGLSTLTTRDVESDSLEQQVAISAGSVTLNGVVAQDVALNFSNGNHGFDMKAFDIGNVGGAKLNGEGSLIDSGDGPQGDLNFTLAAEDPRGFLRLIGLEYGGGHWSDALGQTAIDAKVSAVPQKNGPEINIVARGSSGALNMEVVGNMRELEKGRHMKLAASGGLASADSAVLARLLGVVPQGKVGPGDVTFEFSGAADDGFVYSTRMKALGAVAELKGTASLEQPYWGLAGKLSAMADDGKALLEAFGIPLPTAQGQALNVSLLLAPKDGALNLIDIAAVAGGRNISGNGELTREGRVQLDLETDVLSVNDALALAFMPWRGAPTDLEQRFAAPADTPFAGEIFLKPKLLELPFGGQATEAVVGLGFDSAAHNLNIVVPGDDALNVDMKLEQKGDGAAVTGSARVPYDLAALFREADGKALASGTLLLKGDFKSTGSSPAAALAALEGKGNFWLGKSKLERVTLTGFKEAVLGATTPEALSRALDALDQPPGSEVGQRIGNFEITNGETLFSNFAPDVAGIAANLQPKYDAVANQLQLAASFAITDRPELPPVTVNYVGTPGAMVVRNGTSALAAKLGYELLSTEMAKLEKLQQEEAALLAKEEKQRVDDQQRFDDYQQTRIELREQSRMRKFHAAQRERSAAQLKATLDEALKIGDALNKADLLKQARVRQVRKPSL